MFYRVLQTWQDDVQRFSDICCVYQCERQKGVCMCRPGIGHELCCKVTKWNAEKLEDEDVKLLKHVFMEKMYQGKHMVHTVIVGINLKNIHGGVTARSSLCRKREDIRKLWFGDRQFGMGKGRMYWSILKGYLFMYFVGMQGLQ